MQAWLFTLVILPAKSNVVMRLSLVAYLAILSILVQPAQVWKVSLAVNLNEFHASNGFFSILMSYGAFALFVSLQIFQCLREFPC